MKVSGIIRILAKGQKNIVFKYCVSAGQPNEFSCVHKSLRASGSGLLHVVVRLSGKCYIQLT